MVMPVPTLSLKGWLHDPHEKGSQLMGWFMMAQATQSRTFYGNIASMSELVVKYSKSPGALCDHIRIQLEMLYRAYFEEVLVNVIDLPLTGESEDNTRYQVQITVSAYGNGQRIDIMEGADIGNSTFKRVMEALNGT